MQRPFAVLRIRPPIFSNCVQCHTLLHRTSVLSTAPSLSLCQNFFLALQIFFYARQKTSRAFLFFFFFFFLFSFSAIFPPWVAPPQPPLHDVKSRRTIGCAITASCEF